MLFFYFLKIFLDFFFIFLLLFFTILFNNCYIFFLFSYYFINSNTVGFVDSSTGTTGPISYAWDFGLGFTETNTANFGMTVRAVGNL